MRQGPSVASTVLVEMHLSCMFGVILYVLHFLLYKRPAIGEANSRSFKVCRHVPACSAADCNYVWKANLQSLAMQEHQTVGNGKCVIIRMPQCTPVSAMYELLMASFESLKVSYLTLACLDVQNTSKNVLDWSMGEQSNPRDPSGYPPPPCESLPRDP